MVVWSYMCVCLVSVVMNECVDGSMVILVCLSGKSVYVCVAVRCGQFQMCRF
jgi:hypothetical protein